MAPSEEFEGQELRERKAVLDDELNIAEQGGVLRSGEIANEDQSLRKRNIEKERQREEQEKQRKERVDKKRAADRRVRNDIEARLVVYDERESLLAKQYRAEEEERKGRERAWKERKVREEKERREGKPPVQLETAEGESPLPEDQVFKEVKNLVFIERSPVHRKALEDWQRNEALLTSRVERKTSRAANLKNEVYQLIGFFSVFQGVVLTAVSQANLLHCNNLWSPILLSVLASSVTIAAISQKLYQISAFQETVHTEEQALKDVVTRGRELRREGPNFVFAKFSKNKDKKPKEGFFWLYSGTVIGFLVLFMVAFPLSYWRILCYPGSNPCSMSPPPA